MTTDIFDKEKMRNGAHRNPLICSGTHPKVNDKTIKFTTFQVHLARAHLLSEKNSYKMIRDSSDFFTMELPLLIFGNKQPK